MWFRQYYNLAPTDERFLNATPSDIRIDYYLHFLERRLALAKEKRIEVTKLDDLLGPVTYEEKVAATEKMLAEKAKQKEQSTEPQDVVKFKMVKTPHG